MFFKIRLEIEMISPRMDRPQVMEVKLQFVGAELVDLRRAASRAVAHNVLTPIQILDIILRQYRSSPIVEYVHCIFYI